MSDPREIVMPLMRWWGETPVATAIKQYTVLIALTQTIHLLGLTMFAGTLLILNLRLMGIGFVRVPIPRMASALTPWTIAGLVVLLTSGVFILSSETEKCYEASFFWIKMGLLLTGLSFQFTVYRRALRNASPAGFRTRAIATASFVLWIGVALSGKMIGIYGDDLRREVDPFHPGATSLVP